MNRKLFFTTFLMLLCSLGFGQHWTMDNVQYQNNMLVVGVVQIDGIEQTNADIELAAFHNGVLRGVSKPDMLTADGKTRYVFQHTIHGNTDGELLNFKIYVPGNGENQGKEYTTDYTTLFSANGEIWGDYNTYEPLAINFYERHWSSDVTYENSMTVGCTIIIDGEIQERTDLEMAAFCENGEVRGVAKPVYWAGPNIYFTSLIISGNNNERIDFKVYDPIQGKEISTEYYVTFVNDAMIGEDAPLSIEFITTPYVAQVGDKKYQSLEKAVAAAQAGLEVLIIKEGKYNVPTGKNLTITATVDGVVFDNIGAKNMGGANVTFNNVTFAYANNSTYQGLQHSGNLVYNNCTFNGQVFLYGQSETFNNCKFENTGDNYNVWTYGAKEVAFNECTFNSAGKSVLIYAEDANLINNVTVEDCKFIASAAVDGKAAIEMDSSLTSGINLTISNTTATGFGTGNKSGNSLWNNKKGNDTDVNNDITVVVDDVTVLAPIYEAQIGEVKYRKLGTAFTAAKAGDEVTVFEGTYTLPAMKAGITVVGQGNVLFEGTLSNTLENLTMKNIHIKGANAQRWAYAKGNLVFENVTFEATGVYALHFDGIAAGTNLTYKNCTIIGWAALGGTPASCTFEGCTIKGNGSYGVIRTYFNTTIKDCTFDVANVNTTDVYQDGIHAVGETTIVTVTNCTNSRGEMIDLVNVSGYSVVDLDGTKIMNVAKVVETEKYYWTVTDAINAAQSGQTVELLARTIDEAIKPWAGDASHASEKSITILGAENFGTTLTGGLYLGYDDSGCREHNITIKGIAFEGKGILVAGQKNVVIEGNKFTNITDVVSTSQSANANAISVIGKNVNATVENNVIENIAVAGINLRDVANAEVKGNTITRTTHNAITISAATDATIIVKDNTLAQWGLGSEGRAIRTSGGATVNVNGNVMTMTGAPEEFVKIAEITKTDATIDASANYWNSVSPLTEGMFYTNLTIDPVSILKSYYTDPAKQNLVTLSASVAKIGDKYYQTLPAAIEAAEAGQTIELLADITTTDVILINKSLTINGNNHKVTSSASRVFRVTTSNTEVTLNGVNMVSTAVRVGTNDIRGISVDDVTGVKLTLNNCSVDFTDASACDWSYAVNVVGGSGHVIHVNGGTYEGANVINVRGAGQTVLVKDATLTSLYPNNDLYYGACIYVVQNQNSSVEATGNTFNGNNAIAFNVGYTPVTESNNTDNTTICVAKIGNVYYTSLADAFAAAQDQDGNTIKVLQNIALSESITNTKNVTLDLNGKTITGTDNATGSFGLINNKGNLTINDTKGDGKITLTATNDRDWNAYSSVISNQPGGKLIVENGTIEHLGGTDMAYGIDNLTNGKGTYAETVVNGGTVKSTYRAIRQFLNGIEAQNILTVNGGTIEGANKSIWMQDPSAKANSGKLTVGADASLKGDVYLFVTAGSTEWPVEVSIANAALAEGSTVVTGNVPETYVVKEVNGTWGVFGAVAKIGTTSYQTLQEAVNAAQEDDVIIMIADVKLTATVNVPADKTIILDLNGKTIDGTGNVRIAIMSYGDLTVKDSSANGTIKAGIGTAGNAINICGGTFTLESGNIYSLNNAILIDEQAAEINVKGGKITAEPATRNSAAFYISSTSNTVVNIEAGEIVGYNGILLWNNTEINITGGTINATGSTAIQGNGSKDNTEINISGGTLSGYYAAIYHPQGGELNISDGELTGWTGVVVKGGKVNISGGTINGTGAADPYRPVSSGYVDTGDGLYVEHYDNSTNSENYGTPVVTVTGGTFTSANAKPIASYVNTNNNVEALAKFVSGGTFNKEIEDALCAPAYTCKANNDGTYSVVEGLDGSGTETDPFLITNLTELEYFKASVNAGETTYNQEGVWVALGADIDMTSVANWAPIGSFDVSYDGNFNGQGHKIMNLKMSDNVAATGESYLGFFGVTANNVIKNFVIENVTIESEGQIVAAAIAYPYYTTVSDITVCGDIAIKGGNYTAGVLAYTRLCVNASNLTVSGNSGSYITGTQVVGGVIADIQMNHGLVANYSNFSASGLTITGTKCVGGISGIISAQTLNGATVKNIVLNSEDNFAGIVAGRMGDPSTISGVVFESVTGATAVIGATYDGPKAIEARIVDTYYATLEAALLAEGNNVTLLVPYTVEADETVVLDLNGKTVTMEDASAATSAMIKNYGNLTISNGKLSFKATAPSANNAYASNTISNYGEITIESGIIENLSTGSACYALDNYAGSTATINGGRLTAEKTTVRVFNWTNGEANATTLNVNDGEIYSKDGYGINVNSGNAPYVALNIEGGTITTDDTDYNLAVYVVNKDSAENFTVNVTAGTFNGNFALNGVTSTTMATGNVSISGGAFEGVICYATPAYGFITGGAFVNNPSDYCAENYGAVYNGEYFIVKLISGTQTREFASAGWYWFSTYIDLEGTDGLEALQYTLGENAKQIKGQEGFTQYYKAYQAWSPGGLTAISTAKMYMINTTAPVTVELTGNFVDYEERDITLNTGWNWIGYPVRDTVDVKDALANLTPSNGDAIKSKDVTYTYYWGKWQGNGTLKMTPGMGYMYKSNANNVKTFRYSTTVTNNSRSENTVEEYYWIADASKYPSNMTVIAMLNIEGEAAGDNYEVAAFANGECRGSARPFYVEAIDSYILIMTIQGEEVEELTFKCYDVNYGTEYELSNRVNYSNDAILGSFEEPYMFNMNFLNIEESTLDMINIYPNPTTTDRAINLQATCDNVEVFNALGVKVAEYQNVDSIDALETAGIYVIRLTINGETRNCRLVVK